MRPSPRCPPRAGTRDPGGRQRDGRVGRLCVWRSPLRCAPWVVPGTAAAKLQCSRGACKTRSEAALSWAATLQGRPCVGPHYIPGWLFVPLAAELLTWRLPWEGVSTFKASLHQQQQRQQHCLASCIAPVLPAGASMCAAWVSCMTCPLPGIRPSPVAHNRRAYAPSRPRPPRLLQIALLVLQGDRPEAPPREALPGPDNASFADLDAYMQLMK